VLLVRTIYYCNIAELLLGYNWNSWKNGNLLLTGMYSTGQIAGWKIRNYSRMESECLRETRPSTFQLEKTRLKSNKIWCISSFHHYVGLQTFWMPLTCTHIGVFQPFWCHGTLHKREGHSRNPMHWSVSPATYAMMKPQGVYGLISLAGHWGQNRHEDDKTDKDDQHKIWPH